MKFMAEKRDLSYLTSLVYRAASGKNAIPVLSGLLLEASQEKGLAMTATDMEIGIKASSPDIEVIEEGTVLVNAHYFADFIKLLPDTKISVELNQETAKIVINYGRSSGFINTYREYEYPDLPLNQMEKKISLSQKDLRTALKKTSFAAAATHFRQVFTGVLFDIVAGNQLNVVASDTHRLAYFTCPIPDYQGEPFNFIIPSRTVTELMRVLEDSSDPIHIAFSENNVLFFKDNILLFSRLIEGNYPNYEQVIPASFNTSVCLKGAVLADTLERARTMPSDEKMKIQHVLFSFNTDEAIVSAHSEIMGGIEEVIDDLQVEGEPEVKIAFNTGYFLDVVRILEAESENIQIQLSGSLGPALIKNPEKDDYLYVLVPLRTSN